MKHEGKKPFTVPRGRGEAPFCMGCLWKGNKATFRGRILYLSSVSAFSVVSFLCARWFRVICFVSPPASGLSCGGFVFAKLTSFYILRKYRIFGVSCLPCLESVPRLLGGESGRPAP